MILPGTLNQICTLTHVGTDVSCYKAERPLPGKVKDISRNSSFASKENQVKQCILICTMARWLAGLSGLQNLIQHPLWSELQRDDAKCTVIQQLNKYSGILANGLTTFENFHMGLGMIWGPHSPNLDDSTWVMSSCYHIMVTLPGLMWSAFHL